ncbi:MAG: BrnT family toxin [Anaerolineae bacterium]
MQYNFEWDPSKAKQNLRKHGVSFERAAQIFLDPFAISICDEEHSEEEERWITLGMDRNDVLLVIVHTFREIDPENCNIRIISARKATKREAEQYHEG